MSEPNDSSYARDSDMVSEPVERSRPGRWLLLDGNRLVLAGLVSVGVFLVCVALVWVGLIPVFDAGPLTSLTAGIVGGTLPFITIVLAVNQLVLSQELGWIGTLRERMEGMREFRADVEDLTETRLSPAAPAAFLQFLIRHTDDLIETLAERCEDSSDEDLHADVDRLERLIGSRSDRVAGELEHAEFGTFDALSASLDYDTGQYLYAVRRLRANHADALPTGTEGILDDLTETLAALDIARQYFKTLYTQYELAVLSRLLLYAGFPALVGGGFVVLSYEQVVAFGLGRAVLTVVLAATVVMIFLPFAILLVYALRIATLASYTADFGPFVPRTEVSIFEQE